MTGIVQAMAQRKRGETSRAVLFRALVEHAGWVVPCKTAADGSSGIWMFPGSSGEWWVLAFSDRSAMAAYEASHHIAIGDSSFVTRGRSLVCNLPGGARGVGLDLASPHGIAIFAQELDELVRYGEATEVEDVLLSRSKRDNPWERLRNYAGYRLCWTPDGKVLTTPDPTGRHHAAVFTTADAFDAFRARFPHHVPDAVVVDGVTLFQHLRATPVVGVVFNCAGPHEAVHDIAFAQRVLEAVDGAQAPTAQQAPHTFGAPRMGPEPSRPPDLSPMGSKPDSSEGPTPAVPVSTPAVSSEALDYRPMIVRQDLDELDDGIVSFALVPPTDPTHPIVSPMVCFAARTPDGLVFATPKALGTRSLDELIREGTARLMAEDPPRRATQVGDGGKTVSLHGEHAAEALLVPEMLHDIGKEIGASWIAVALPTRGVLIACAMHDLNGTAQLAQTAQKTYDALGTTGLYPSLVAVVNGVIQGPIDMEMEEESAEEGPFRARSMAECGLYLTLRNCPEAGREENITADEGDDVVVQYDCKRDGLAPKRFLFRINKIDLATTSADGPIRYGKDDTPSQLCCAGQFFEGAEALSKACPGSLDGLDKDRGLIAMRTIEHAAACMDEVIKFIPAGQDMVPEAAFFTSMGKKTQAAQPTGRWSRLRLGAVRDTYRRIADGFRATAHQRGWLY